MNRAILMGRLTRDPEVRYSSGERSMAIARYTLAVDRGFKRGGDSSEQTLYHVLHLIKPASLQRDILDRE